MTCKHGVPSHGACEKCQVNKALLEKCRRHYRDLAPHVKVLKTAQLLRIATDIAEHYMGIKEKE